MEEQLRHNQVYVGDSSIHVVESGKQSGPTFLLLHGWPESWCSWQPMMTVAGNSARIVAIDLPGVGGSTGSVTDGSKSELAKKVHDLISILGLEEVTLVGQDVGGMVVYAYLRKFQDIRRAVIMDVVLPGIAPWENVIRNPYIWHFALHAVPSLPERLVHGRQAEYFRFFYDTLSFDRTKITPEARAAYIDAYSTEGALTAGFNWYRTFARDAEENRMPSEHELTTPLLYLRGEHESGNIRDYVDGLRAAGAMSIQQGIVPAAGHFAQEEAPEATWRLLAELAAGAGFEKAAGNDFS
jgi:pimeloyl-ACP methyl ester carboxylesterase